MTTRDALVVVITGVWTVAYLRAFLHPDTHLPTEIAGGVMAALAVVGFLIATKVIEIGKDKHDDG